MGFSSFLFISKNHKLLDNLSCFDFLSSVLILLGSYLFFKNDLFLANPVLKIDLLILLFYKRYKNL